MADLVLEEMDDRGERDTRLPGSIKEGLAYYIKSVVDRNPEEIYEHKESIQLALYSGKRL